MSLSVLLQVRTSELRLCPTCTSTMLWYYKTCNVFKKQNILASISLPVHKHNDNILKVIIYHYSKVCNVILLVIPDYSER